MKFEEALNNIKDSYDAFCIKNKYGKGTHNKEFELLATLPDLSLEKGALCLCWIKYQYDCYYKEDYEDEKGTAFEFIRKICREHDKEN